MSSSRAITHGDTNAGDSSCNGLTNDSRSEYNTSASHSQVGEAFGGAQRETAPDDEASSYARNASEIATQFTFRVFIAVNCEECTRWQAVDCNEDNGHCSALRYG